MSDVVGESPISSRSGNSNRSSSLGLGERISVSSFVFFLDFFLETLVFDVDGLVEDEDGDDDDDGGSGGVGGSGVTRDLSDVAVSGDTEISDNFSASDKTTGVGDAIIVMPDRRFGYLTRIRLR